MYSLSRVSLPIEFPLLSHIELDLPERRCVFYARPNDALLSQGFPYTARLHSIQQIEVD